MDRLPMTAEALLCLLRQLPLRERLRVVTRVLGDFESELPLAATTLWSGVPAPDGSEAAALMEDFDPCWGGTPEDESVEAFLARLQSWQPQKAR